jgi:HPt (histidine-containing phosphotransfer) domain-containing protein
MSTLPCTCLSIDRALEYVADLEGVHVLLGTLQQSLQDDLPQLQAQLDAGNLPAVQRALHQIKGFAPVFCPDELVAEVVHVEGLSKRADLQTVRTAYAHLGPQLQRLLAEVQAHLAAPR